MDHSDTKLTLIFLFSLPRSGSTLCQRILGAHEGIETVAEPYILLPLIHSLKGKGIYSIYSHEHAVTVIQDFCLNLSRGRDDYLAEMHEFALRLY